MKEKVIKRLALGGVLALSLALTGCYVPPDDLSSLDTPSYKPQQTVFQLNTATPTSAPVTDVPTVVWSTNPSTQPSIGITTPNVVTSAPTKTPAPTNSPSPTPAESLKLGAPGQDVRALQRKLKDLGYYKGSVDGDFGENTEAAVKAFQDNNGLTVDGKAGTKTLAKLNSSTAKKAPATTASRTKTPKPARTATPKPTNTPVPKATATPDLTRDYYLRSGSSGSKVRTLQNRLIQLGWMEGKADGSYGGATEYAVKAFQAKYSSLYDDGVAGPSTLKILYSNSAVKASSPVSSLGTKLEEGDQGNAVKAMQKRLRELGFLKSTADGSFGQVTKAAVIAFQTANGLKADGKAGSGTLSKLYSADAADASSLTQQPTTVPGTQTTDQVSVGQYTTLEDGASGTAVENLQRALKNLGYYSGPVDGDYGHLTIDAVKAFQQRMGLRVDGKAGPTTQRALYGDDAKANKYDTLRPGDHGTEVRNLQYTLYELGYYDGKTDGSYGSTTQDAVRAFQIRNDITPVDGIAGDKTLKVLYSNKAISASAQNTSYTSLKKGDKGDAVVQLQDNLMQLGYLTEVTGYYDNATVTAVKNFQQRNGLTADGSAGQETLAVLYSENPVTAY